MQHSAQERDLSSTDIFINKPRQHEIDFLGENRTFLESLLGITSEAIICVNESQQIILYSAGAEVVFGYAETEIIGQPLSELIAGKFHQVHEEHITKFVESSAQTLLMHQRRPIFGRRKNGEIFPAQASISKHQSSEGLVLVVILRDISSQNQLEERLSKLSVVVEQTPASVVITDTRGTIEYVNPAFERVTGYTLDEIIGGNPRLLKSGLMPEELYQNMWKTISAGLIWKGELCNRKKNGDLFWELGTVSPIRNKDGVITNYISVKEDITEYKKIENELNQYRLQLEELVEIRTAELHAEINEHKQTESKLLEKEQSLTLALRIGQLGSWEYDISTGDISWTDEVYRIFGLDPADQRITFDKVIAMVHPDDRTMVQAALGDAIESWQPLNIDHRIISLSGQEHFINLTIVPIYDTDKVPIKMIGTVQDITERVRMNTELLEKERMSKELSIASDIQLGMLPKVSPSLDGWQFAVFYQAARQVGGDFYDFIKLPGGKIGLVIADVSGKGMPAALSTALSSAIVRTNALTGGCPVETLVRSNQILHHYFQDSGFVTILFAELDPSTGSMEIANAGHCYPVWYSFGKKSVNIEITHGMLIGLFPKISIEPVTIKLKPGDVILFYTDGLTEATNEHGEYFEEDRLLDLFKANAHLSAAEILETIKHTWLDFVGQSVQGDDLTLIVARRDE